MQQAKKKINLEKINKQKNHQALKFPKALSVGELGSENIQLVSIADLKVL